MTTQAQPRILQNSSGLRVTMNDNGSLRRIDHEHVMLNLFVGSAMEGGPANVYLRLVDPHSAVTPLLGPGSPALIEDAPSGFAVRGTWHGLSFRVQLHLAPDHAAWLWQVKVTNQSARPITFDLVHAQDLGLAHYAFIRTNEYFVSQYLDHTPLMHTQLGQLLTVRQNQAVNGCHPWCAFGALAGGVGYCTDALQFYGLEARRGAQPRALTHGLPSQRLQHEHALAALADTPLTLAPGATTTRGFFSCFVADHPRASGPDDLALIAHTAAWATAQTPTPEAPSAQAPTTTLFTSAPTFDAQPWSFDRVAARYGAPQMPEYLEGEFAACFAAQDTYIALPAKELAVQRAHGQILRSGTALVPDEGALTSTVWLGGIFNSMLTQGHVGINRMLSASRGYLNLFRALGQRVFVDYGDGWQLLDMPSAWASAPGTTRWHYANQACAFELSTTAQAQSHAIDLRLEVSRGGPLRLLVTHHVALDDDDGADVTAVDVSVATASVYLRPQPGSALALRFGQRGFRIAAHADTAFLRCRGAEALFSDGAAHGACYVCIELEPSHAAGLRITGDLLDTETVSPALLAPPAGLCAALQLAVPSASPAAAAIARWSAILPWFADNALVHYLAPRGLEQFTGGGWGTRDICQGPLEMLLALDQQAPARDLLLRVFRQQNATGDWPQWFSFFARERHIRAADAHGDIVFWPLLGLARYLEASGDAAVLDAHVPYYASADTIAPAADSFTLWEHVERALAFIRTQMIGTSALVAYGHGDWNDSMQPADPRLREELCSSWTVTLHHLMLTSLARALERCHRTSAVAALRSWADDIAHAFQQQLIVDGVVPGYAHFHADGRRDYLLHPRDAQTGVCYSLLPLPHAVLTGLLDATQAADHLRLIREHLCAPDGARLFDRPLAYRGGVAHLFQRAETAAFFGREIGLLYTHAHLRYAEALAYMGRADEFFDALNLVNPIELATLLPSASPRQSNCYYSSSDAAFPDRYAAYDEYARVRAGSIGFDGGWRVYSSGPGLAIAILVRCLLGLRRAGASLIIDPVLPRALDGLQATYLLDQRPCRFTYRVGPCGYGVHSVHVNGVEVHGTQLAHPFRRGGLEITEAARLLGRVGACDHWLITLA